MLLSRSKLRRILHLHSINDVIVFVVIFHVVLNICRVYLPKKRVPNKSLTIVSLVG